MWCVYIVVHSSRGDEVSAQEKAVLTGTASQTQRKVSGRNFKISNFLVDCRDKMMEEHVTEKLSAVDKELGRLQAEERQIEKSLKTKSERKKLRIF